MGKKQLALAATAILSLMLIILGCGTGEDASYQQILEREEREPVMVDGEIQLVLSELLERASEAEKFLTDYPDSRYYEKVLELYSYYMDCAITGGYEQSGSNYYTSATEPIQIDPYAINTYQTYVCEYENKTSELLERYLGILKKSDRRIDRGVQRFYREIRRCAQVGF